MIDAASATASESSTGVRLWLAPVHSIARENVDRKNLINFPSGFRPASSRNDRYASAGRRTGEIGRAHV